MSDISNLLEGKVAGVLSERELTINIGFASGVVVGMNFKVLSAEQYEVYDPVSNELLGVVDREKVRVRVVDVQEKFSICKTYRKWTTSGGSLYNLTSASLASIAAMAAGPRTVYETLKSEDSSLPAPLSEEESYVKRGDRVLQIVEDDD